MSISACLTVPISAAFTPRPRIAGQRKGIVVRVIDYRLKGRPRRRAHLPVDHHHPGPGGRLPAKELAALYHERWEIETALDELKTHLRGAQIVLRSKTPELVRAGVLGPAHGPLRHPRPDARSRAKQEDPDRLSFLHSVRVVQRRMARFVAIPPSAEENLA
jgi:hypothetical protein